MLQSWAFSKQANSCLLVLLLAGLYVLLARPCAKVGLRVWRFRAQSQDYAWIHAFVTVLWIGMHCHGFSCIYSLHSAYACWLD